MAPGEPAPPAAGEAAAAAPADFDDLFDDAREATFVEEADELKRLAAAIEESQGGAPEATFRRLKQILEKYQEQPQLLDAHLEPLTASLMAVLRAEAFRCVADGAAAQAAAGAAGGSAPAAAPATTPTADAAARAAAVRAVGKAVWGLCTVRGRKTVVRFFPHEPADLEPCVALLERCDADAAAAVAARQSLDGIWEARCSLLLWLSMLVLIPFDLATVDSALGASAAAAATAATAAGGPAAAVADAAGVPPLVRRVLSACERFLGDPGAVRDVAAVTLSCLLTRPDMRSSLQAFLDWAERSVLAKEPAADSPGAGTAEAEAAAVALGSTFVVPGTARALAAIFKRGLRAALAPDAPRAWAAASGLWGSRMALRSALVRQLAVKLGQRAGLLLLPPRQATWRYSRGHGSLDTNLGASGAAADAAAPAAAPAAAAVAPDAAADDDGEFEVPESVEELVGLLLGALKDSDTVVRWSAAKGLGRITSRLPPGLGDQVVASITELLTPAEEDGAWQGACLALAELARRGLLLPARLLEAAPLVAQALLYDQRRGAHSVGAHVRDAAAYACWAFARAYDPPALLPALPAVVPSLLTAVAFDREVNCRRAASAAFQELVGRLGTFEHGIDIVTVADYFAVGSRRRAFTSIAPVIAALPPYTRPLLAHLLDVKLRHWDSPLRELAADALAALTPCDPSYVASVGLPKLLELCLAPDLLVRHGAALGAAAAVRALAGPGGAALDDAAREAVLGCVPAIEKARLYRGKGGEIMRGAVCRLIEAIGRVKLAMNPKARKALLDSLEDHLKHPNPEIQAAAVRAAGPFCRAFVEPSAAGVDRTARRWAAVLRDEPNAAARRGAAMALGVLPAGVLAAAKEEVVAALLAATRPEESAEARDAETRAAAVRALAALCETLGVRGAAGAGAGAFEPAEIRGPLVEAYLSALQDYNTDDRGDVGSWVREAAMDALERAAWLLRPRGASPGPTEEAEQAALANRILPALLQQASEKIDRLRGLAGACAARLLHGAPPTPLHLGPLPGLVILYEPEGGPAGPPAAAAGALAPGADAGGAPAPMVVVPASTAYRAELEAAIPSSGVAWAVPTEAYPRLGPLLRCPGLRPALVRGFLVSAGGLTDSMSRVAGAALIAALEAAGCAGGAGAGLADAVAADIAAEIAAHARDDRVVLPALRALELLLGRGLLPALAGAVRLAEPPAAAAGPAGAPSTASALVERIEAEVKGSKDVQKLLAAVAVLAQLCGAAAWPARCRALRVLLMLLLGRYPRVRRAAAEQLYVRLLAAEDEGGAAGGAPALEAVLNALTDTPWADAEVHQLRPVRDTLYAPLRLGAPPPPPAGASAAAAAAAAAAKARAADENSSYAALVDSAGY